MKYYLIAGEASGDLHGANLMRALKKEDPDADFRFFGGDLMQAEGGVLKMHYAKLAFMGFIEIFLNMSSIFKSLKIAKEDILTYQPDVLILIDFAGFNLKIAAFAKKAGISVFYYILPKIWAWNEQRALKIKANVDRLFCILPFEVDFYKKWGMEVDYVGNPLLDAIAANKSDSRFRKKHKIEQGKPIVALLPGSRKQELKRILPELVQVLNYFPDCQFIIAGAPTYTHQDYAPFIKGIKDKNVLIVFNETYNLLLDAQAAIVTSGTATLETALLKVPQVVVYKGNPASVLIGRIFIKVKFISLVNLILNKMLVKEFIQSDCKAKVIEIELKKLLNDPFYRGEMLEGYKQLEEKIGDARASDRTAKLIWKALKEQSSKVVNR